MALEGEHRSNCRGRAQPQVPTRDELARRENAIDAEGGREASGERIEGEWRWAGGARPGEKRRNDSPSQSRGGCCHRAGEEATEREAPVRRAHKTEDDAAVRDLYLCGVQRGSAQRSPKRREPLLMLEPLLPWATKHSKWNNSTRGENAGDEAGHDLARWKGS